MADQEQFYLDNQDLIDNLPLGRSGVTISQHGSGDDRFPGWQVNLGLGTFKGGEQFPNDDASHIQVDDGFRVILREHGPSDERYPGEEIEYIGPITTNLDDFNDKLSEIEVIENTGGRSMGNFLESEPDLELEPESDLIPQTDINTDQPFLAEADNRVEETYTLSYNTKELKFLDSEHSVIDMREDNNIISIDLRSVVYKPEPFSEIFDVRIKSY